MPALSTPLLNAQQNVLDEGWHRVSPYCMPALPSRELNAQYLLAHI